MGFLRHAFLGGNAGGRACRCLNTLPRKQTTELQASDWSGCSLNRDTVSSTRHRRLRYLLLFALRTLAGVATGAGVCRDRTSSTRLKLASDGKLPLGGDRRIRSR